MCLIDCFLVFALDECHWCDLVDISRPHTLLEDIILVQLPLSMWFWRWNHLSTGHKLYAPPPPLLSYQQVLCFCAHVELHTLVNISTPHNCQALLLALHKLRLSEEQQKSVIDAHEPLVAFALSCGMYSSPAVRIFHVLYIDEVYFIFQRSCLLCIFSYIWMIFWWMKNAGKGVHC
jgi:hypothetical protein